MSITLPYYLTTKDFTLLEVMLERGLAAHDPMAPLLRRKLSGATVVFRDEIPKDVVTLNSRVAYRLGDGPMRVQTLILGNDRSTSGMALTVATPRGLALLGRSEGQSVTVERPDGAGETLTIEVLAYQPEAATRRRAGSEGAIPRTADTGEPAPVLAFKRRAVHRPAPDDDPGPSAA
jgi:regulator of nucleoside diphosphate kinase